MLPVDTLWYSGDLLAGSGDDLNTNTQFASDMENDIRVYAPFIITGPNSWKVTGLFSNNIKLLTLPIITQASWEIRSNVMAGNGGLIIDSGTDPCTIDPTGRTFGSYTEYMFKVSISKILAPGTYWMNVTPIVPASTPPLDFLYNSFTIGTNQVGDQSDKQYFQNGIILGSSRNFVPLLRGSPPTPYNTSNGVIGKIQQVVCLHPRTLVLTANGNIPIKDITEGTYVVDHQGKMVKVLYNIYFDRTVRKFVRIPKGSLSKHLPNQDILIRKGHPIFFEGKRQDPLRLGKESIKEVSLKEAVTVFSLCTEHDTYVLMHGVPVATWSQESWEKYSESFHILWFKK